MSTSDHILFSAGGIHLAADSASVHCIHESLPTQNESGTNDWFLGLAVASERLLPVTDLGVYLQGGQSIGRVIEVARALGIAGLKIDEVHGVSNKIPEPIIDDSLNKSLDDSPNDRREGTGGSSTANDQQTSRVDPTETSPVLNKAILDQGQRYRLLDIEKLMQSARFLNVKCPSV